MLVLLSAIFGFIGSAIAPFFKYIQDKQDKLHELEVMKLQLQSQTQMASMQFQEIQNNAANVQLQTLYASMKPTGTIWDSINNSIRPVITYTFMLLYIAFKCIQFYMVTNSNETLEMILEYLWGTEDQCTWSALITFYFGTRAFYKK